ncbi:unnamed protein product [Diatraea saccharalis]|uniref:MADF domain-containing protein n=1 Tax=Diatraea saccharalis TaxID=40085 RepID=A0A9N9R2Y4_9NEOP|nr:unnamed protein product [Diatraea saccharalis]
MTDKQLIEYVKQRPVLYDKSQGLYRDNIVRNIAWEEIAELMDAPVEDIKEKWAKLRNAYNSALQRRRKKTNLKYPWKFEKKMEFLMPFIDGKSVATNFSIDSIIIDDDTSTTNISSDDRITNKHANVTNDEDSTRDSEDSEVSPSPVQSPAQGGSTSHDVATNIITTHTIKSKSYDALLRDMVDMMKSSHAMKLKRTITDMDENDHFFLSMSKRLKTLPPRDQADIKFQIHKLIHDFEIKMLKSNDKRTLLN